MPLLLATAAAATGSAVLASATTARTEVSTDANNTNNDADDTNHDAILTVQGYKIEDIDDVPPHVRRHAEAFYNKLITIFENASAQLFLIKHAEYF
jgi:hypothetical protein